jgi:hypothetical protein
VKLLERLYWLAGLWDGRGNDAVTPAPFPTELSPEYLESHSQDLQVEEKRGAGESGSPQEQIEVLEERIGDQENELDKWEPVLVAADRLREAALQGLDLGGLPPWTKGDVLDIDNARVTAAAPTQPTPESGSEGEMPCVDCGKVIGPGGKVTVEEREFGGGVASAEGQCAECLRADQDRCPERYGLKVCPACNGEGDVSPSDQCPECFGRGLVQAAPCKGSEVERWMIFGRDEAMGHGAHRCESGPKLAPGESVEVVSVSDHQAQVEQLERERDSAHRDYEKVCADRSQWRDRATKAEAERDDWHRAAHRERKRVGRAEALIDQAVKEFERQADAKDYDRASPDSMVYHQATGEQRAYRAASTYLKVQHPSGVDEPGEKRCGGRGIVVETWRHSDEVGGGSVSSCPGCEDCKPASPRGKES